MVFTPVEQWCCGQLNWQVCRDYKAEMSERQAEIVDPGPTIFIMNTVCLQSRFFFSFLRLSAVCTVLTQLLFHYLCPVDWCWPCYINEVCVDLTLHFDPQYHTWQSLLSEYFLHKNHDNTDNVIILVTVIMIWNFQRRKKCWKVNACSKIVLEGN